MIIRKIKEGDRWIYVIGSIVPKIGGLSWEPLMDFTTLGAATDELNYMNGGTGRPQ